jgi:hypothetical protein
LRVELIYNRNDLTLDAGQVQDVVAERFRNLNFSPYADFEFVSFTVMSKWLVVEIEFPNVTEKAANLEGDYPKNYILTTIIDGIAGEIVVALCDKGFGVRYRHFTVLGEGPSLIFK